MITVKPTAKFKVFRSQMLSILPNIESVYMIYGVKCQITCGTDSHGPDDPHTHGFAYDFSTHAISQSVLKPMHQQLVDELGPDYTVLYDDKNLAEAKYIDTPNSHFHIQYRKSLWHAIIDHERNSS